MDALAGSGRPLRPSIKIVEDDPGVRRSMQLLFQGQGFDVRAYPSGEALLADKKSGDPACMVVDYKLSGIDGIALLELLRESGWNSSAVLVTGFPSADLAQRASDAGFALLFEKPLRERSLIEAVRRLAEGYGATPHSHSSSQDPSP